MDKKFKWLGERVEKVPDANWLYKIICFLLFRRKRKLSYNELYLFLRGLNEKKLGTENADRMAFKKIIEIYRFNNNRLPV